MLVACLDDILTILLIPCFDDCQHCSKKENQKLVEAITLNILAGGWTAQEFHQEQLDNDIKPILR